VGSLWMVGLGTLGLAAGLSSHPDATGIVMILFLFAACCVPFAFLAYVVVSSIPKGAPSASCVDCGRRMRYSYSRSKWICDRCQTSQDGPSPSQEKKPETGVGSAAWEANRLREIRELMEKERRKATEWRTSHTDA